MNYKLAINHILKHGFTKILVTGCPRSGTRITTKILADELGFSYYQEEKIGVRNLSMLNDLIKDDDNFVVQCSGIFPQINGLNHDEKTCVVFAARDFEEIKKSFDRLGWKDNGKGRLNFYYQTFNRVMPGVKKPAWELAATYFYDYLQPILGKQAIASEYASLEQSPLYVPKELRVKFTPTQTENKDVKKVEPEKQEDKTGLEKIKRLVSENKNNEAIIIMAEELYKRRKF